MDGEEVDKGVCVQAGLFGFSALEASRVLLLECLKYEF